MRDLIVEISNLRMLRAATRAMLHRSKGAPGITVVTGAVGLGKTTATRHICLTEDAIWVEALPDWTPRWMCADIAEELGAARAHSTEQNFRAIIGALRQNRRAIFVDESDHLMRQLRLAESLRAIHDATDAPLILIGMAALPRAIRALPQLESRVAHWVEFQPCGLRDTRAMAEGLCEIELGDDLIKHVHQATAGSARAIRVALERLETFGRRKMRRRLTLDDVPEDFSLIYSRRGKPASTGVAFEACAAEPEAVTDAAA